MKDEFSEVETAPLYEVSRLETMFDSQIGGNWKWGNRNPPILDDWTFRFYQKG